MKYIKANNSGMRIMVDNEDYPLLSRFTVHTDPAKTSGYFYARINLNNKTIKLHHLIMGSRPIGFVVDHINGNGLDNRKSNLRWATPTQNAQNQNSPIVSKSGFKGVTKRHGNKIRIWHARISFKGDLIALGSYATKIEAAKAYDQKAIELYGEHCFLNFPKDRIK